MKDVKLYVDSIGGEGVEEESWENNEREINECCYSYTYIDIICTRSKEQKRRINVSNHAPLRYDEKEGKNGAEGVEDDRKRSGSISSSTHYRHEYEYNEFYKSFVVHLNKIASLLGH